MPATNESKPIMFTSPIEWSEIKYDQLYGANHAGAEPVVSDLGIFNISAYINLHIKPEIVFPHFLRHTVGTSIKNNAGSFAKRVNTHLHREFNIKIDPKMIVAVGNLANQYKIDNSTIYFDLVNRVDWKAGDFGDRGSCFWGVFSETRLAIENSELGAIRFWSKKSDNQYVGKSRAWLVNRPRYVAITNGYGEATLTQANMLGEIIGKNPSQVHFRQARNYRIRGGAPFYFNRGQGYVIPLQDEWIPKIISLPLIPF